MVWEASRATVCAVVKVAVTWGGTYIHATDDGRRTLCGARVYSTSLDEFDPKDDLSCGRCVKSLPATAELGEDGLVRVFDSSGALRLVMTEEVWRAMRDER